MKKRLSNLATLIIPLLLLSSLSIRAAKVNQAVDIQVNGETRSYWLYVPNNVKAKPPMVMALHGASGSMTNNSPRFNEIADKEGFIIVYPQGKEIYFPVFGGKVTGWDASGEDNEDVTFLRAVIEDVATRYAIDRRRLYCCGFSNGGMMTYAMTNTCSEIFAACAAISGFPLNEFHFRHTGVRPVPFLHIHGKQDDFVRYALMPTIVDEMVMRLGANPIPKKTTVSGRYDKSIYAAADGGFPYNYYEIDGMGHNDYTANTEDNSSSQTMWNFFKKYTLASKCDTTLRWRPRLEAEGFEPKQHGWTVNTGKTLLMFGREQNTQTNQNVYHSLQFDNGTYKLCFDSEGEEGKTISVRLQKLTGKKNTLVNKNLPVGEPATLFFTVADGWGEYKLTFTRAATTDAITITNLGIYTATEEEVTGIRDLKNGQWTIDNGQWTIDNSQLSTVNCPLSTIYDLQGRRVSSPRHGIYIKNGKKAFVK